MQAGAAAERDLGARSTCAGLRERLGRRHASSSSSPSRGALLAVTLVGGRRPAARPRRDSMTSPSSRATCAPPSAGCSRRLRGRRAGDDAPPEPSRRPRPGSTRSCSRPLKLPDGPVVIVPTGALHGLSWGALPSLAGRPVTVSPSAELWHRRGRRARVPRRTPTGRAGGGPGPARRRPRGRAARRAATRVLGCCAARGRHVGRRARRRWSAPTSCTSPPTAPSAPMRRSSPRCASPTDRSRSTSSSASGRRPTR